MVTQNLDKRSLTSMRTGNKEDLLADQQGCTVRPRSARCSTRSLLGMGPAIPCCAAADPPTPIPDKERRRCASRLHSPRSSVDRHVWQFLPQRRNISQL
jgi:hypothetical protein